ncbi:MAG: hypothetical protein AAGC71_01785 [Pseudomonadota bacterium]
MRQTNVKPLLYGFAIATVLLLGACGRSDGEQMVFDNCMDTLSDKKLCGCTADAFGEYLESDDFEWLSEMSEGGDLAFGTAMLDNAFGDADPQFMARMQRLQVAGKKAEKCL